MRSAFLASFGSRFPLRAGASLRRACRAALALPFCVVDLIVSGMALSVLHVGWNISLDIESRFANVLVCAGLFAQECKTSGFADLFYLF